MEAKRKEICAHEIDNHWTLVIKIELNDIKTIMSIWHFNGNRYPYGRLIKQKSCLCAQGGMKQQGVDYWETYAPVANWMSVRASHQASRFFQAYTQADVKTEIFMEISIGFELKGTTPYNRS